jgi:hypothetical protein
VDWIHLAQNRAQWQVTVKTEINFRVTKEVGNFLSMSD